MEITCNKVSELFASIATVFQAKRDELCAMDAKLGDGDLGLTMSKGFAALPKYMEAEAAEVAGDIGRLLMKAGMKMSSEVPSTMGFLMSTGILEGGKALRGATALNGANLASYLEGFAAGVQKRGKCCEGQRTIYDALKPAADAALAAAVPVNANMQTVMTAALQAAAVGVENTKSMKPVFGKAAVHAAQSAGIADQGAVAGYYMLLGMWNYISGIA